MSYVMQSTGMPPTHTISTSSGYIGARRFLALWSTQCIPKLRIYKQRNLPWLSASIKKAMQKRDRLFKKYGYHAKYKVARNQVTNLCRRAKKQYFQQLNPNDPKCFWKYVKYANNNKPSIPVLQNDGVEYVTDQEKAQKLNSYFFMFQFFPPSTFAN